MGFVWVIFFFLILCPLGVLIRWLFCFLCILMDLNINLLVFITMPSKTQASTNITTLEIGFGTRFKCGVCGLTGLRHMTFSAEQRINIFFSLICYLAQQVLNFKWRWEKCQSLSVEKVKLSLSLKELKSWTSP